MLASRSWSTRSRNSSLSAVSLSIFKLFSCSLFSSLVAFSLNVSSWSSLSSLLLSASCLASASASSYCCRSLTSWTYLAFSANSSWFSFSKSSMRFWRLSILSMAELRSGSLSSFHHFCSPWNTEDLLALLYFPWWLFSLFTFFVVVGRRGSFFFFCATSVMTDTLLSFGSSLSQITLVMWSKISGLSSDSDL